MNLVNMEPGLQSRSPMAEHDALSGGVRSRFGGLALPVALVGLGIASLGYPAGAQADGLAVTVDAQPDSNGNDQVTITNNGAACVRDNLLLTQSTMFGGSSSESTTDIDSSLSPGSAIHIGIGPSAEGSNASINVYDCSDGAEANPLVPPTTFIFEKGYNTVIGTGQGSSSGGSSGSTTGGETTTTTSSGSTTTTSSGGTSISVSSSGSQTSITNGSGPANGEHCVVPKTFKNESIRQAARSLVRAHCRVGAETHSQLTSLERAQHFRWIVNGFTIMVPAKVPHGRTAPFTLKPVRPGQVLPPGTTLFSRELVRQVR